MVETEVAAIPYERQQDADGNRMCGAAALCMVYRSFGVACAQADVWHAVAGGTRSARTRLICVDCLQRGFDALIVRARVPWDVLRVCSGNSIRAILNHRIAHTSPHGHYTVLVGLDDGRAVVHDPKAGPAQNLDRTLLLQLWQPNGPASEITGRVLVAIARREHATVVVCSRCRAPIPESARCGRCAATIRLQPAAVLGCVAEDCDGRLWEALFCPQCDTDRNQITPAGDEPTDSLFSKE
jgi:ribosomal protein L40E